VVLDPPYAEDDTPAVLTHLLRPGWLSEDAVVVIERASRAAPLELPEVLVLAWERRYGDTLLTVVNYTTTGNISDSTTDSPRDSPTDREG
jgi:16S rRNA (guanine966-N2)-methyltransferase